MNGTRHLFCLVLALLAATSACDCPGKAVDQAKSLATRDAATEARADAGVDVTTRRRVELDFRKLRQERSLSDFLGVYLKYHQLLNARLMRFDEAMCKGGERSLLDGTRKFADTLLKDPRAALTQAKTEMEAPPLHLAALLCQPELASLLLRRGADPKATDSHGLTALHWVSCAPVARVLLDAGAGAKVKSSQGLTPLHLAIDRPTVKALLAAGAEMEAQDACGNRPLHTASKFGLSFPPEKLAGDAGGRPADLPAWLRALDFTFEKLVEVLQLLHDRFDVVGELEALGADRAAKNAAGNLPSALFGRGGGWDD